jgi:hypothetical protein
MPGNWRAGALDTGNYTFNNSGATDPLNRGFRGSTAQGTDLQVWGTVF